MLQWENLCRFYVKISHPCETLQRDLTNMWQQKSKSALLPAVCSRGALLLSWACSGCVLGLHKESTFTFNKIGNTARVRTYEWIWIVCLRKETDGNRRVAHRFYRAVRFTRCWHVLTVRSYEQLFDCVCLHRADLCTLQSQRGWLTFLKFLFVCFSMLNHGSVIVTAAVVCQCFGWKTGGCLFMRRS